MSVRSGVPALSSPRQEIALSWARSRLLGVVPEDAMAHIDAGEFDAQSRLMAAARPVLDTLEAQLVGSAHSILLADRDCRVVYRWFDESRAERAFNELGVRPGAMFLEDSIGTNALGTALELRRGVAVNGAEHFAIQLKPFSCYGQPIHHPLTNRVEGVLDFTSVGPTVNPLLAALVAHSVRHVEQRLLDGARASERRLFAAFQTMTAHRRHPIVALGENVVLSNRAALDLLNPADFAMLRALIGDGPAGAVFGTDLPLQNGMRAAVLAHTVEGSAGGTLFEVTPIAEFEVPPIAETDCPVGGTASSGGTGFPGGSAGDGRVRGRSTVAARLPVLISGAPGTGRTRAARTSARRFPMLGLEPGLAALEGESAWAQRFADGIDAGVGTVVVEGIDLLPDALLDLVVSRAKGSLSADLIVTSGPMSELTGLARTLASMCVRSVDLLPLSQRGSAIGQLAGQILDELSGGAPLRLTPSALDALATQQWRGNFHELRAVMTYVASRRSAGDITVNDLPPSYQATGPTQNLGALERAERDTIVAALQHHAGNKLQAAKTLGVSRGTLYNRMRSLRITA